MVTELVDWFHERFGGEYGGITCAEILDGKPGNKAARCPGIVTESFQKVKELLVQEGFDLAGEP